MTRTELSYPKILLRSLTFVIIIVIFKLSTVVLIENRGLEITQHPLQSVQTDRQTESRVIKTHK